MAFGVLGDLVDPFGLLSGILGGGLGSSSLLSPSTASSTTWLWVTIVAIIVIAALVIGYLVWKKAAPKVEYYAGKAAQYAPLALV